MNKKKLYWICQILGWGSYGILQVSLFSFTGNIDLKLVIGEFFQVLFYILLTHLLRGSIIKLGWLNVKWYLLIPRIIAAIFLLSFISYGILLLISILLGTFKPEQDLNILTVIASVITSMGLFLFWSLIYLSFHYFDRYNKSLQYEAMVREVELSNLKSQLNPHFIFNALNSIRALVGENPEKSKSAITQLSNILRNSLNSDRQKLVSFGEEIAMVKDYLALESIRYEERLNTEFDIDPDSYRFSLPPLMLQTLVENGIKHGISTLTHGGTIKIVTKKCSSGLTLWIYNSGKYMSSKKPSVGYGLLNTRKRLELIYGDAASFKIYNDKNSNTVITEISIPEYI
jgi:sensor histidine kinase YesM